MTPFQTEVELLADRLEQAGVGESYAALITTHLVMARRMMVDALGDDLPPEMHALVALIEIFAQKMCNEAEAHANAHPDTLH
jgi:hypothetical protein